MYNSQNMEMKTEEMKVMHNQRARILKEDDEIWISSEDLNTENSSDEDKSKTKHAFKKKLKLKNRKRSSPNIRLQRPSIPSVPSTSKELDDRLLMPNTDDAQSRSTDDSRTSDEEYHLPPISSECLSKRLSLEDWRPTRGSLTISSLEETASASGDARKIANESGNFYNTMLYKLKSLKSCSVLNSARKEKLDVKEKLPVVVADKTFKYLKNTPEVIQKLDFINKLDEEIKETITRYQTERDERLSTEFEICKSISEHALGEEKGTESFLQMCNFEERLKRYREEAGCVEMESMEQTDGVSESETQSNVNEKVNEESYHITQSCNDIVREENSSSNFMPATNFIRKNIYAAKEGIMAGCSLTDEEKTKIADLLKDIDNFQMNKIDPTISDSSLTQVDERQEGENDLDLDVTNGVNAFEVPERDRIRMREIDCQLEKFTEDQEQNEKTKQTIPVIKDEEFWKQYALDQSLKEIDAKLEKLYASYVEDEIKLKQIPHREEGEQETEDNEENQMNESTEENLVES